MDLLIHHRISHEENVCFKGINMTSQADIPLSGEFTVTVTFLVCSILTFRNVKNTNKKETNNAVPFSLVAPGTFIKAVSVRVQSPMEAGGSYLEQVYQRVRHAKEDLVSFMVQELSGEKPMALEEREELLRVGTVLTGFGQVVLEHDQMLTLQPPHDGRPYLLFSGDHHSFMQMHHNSANMWKLLSALFGIMGAALLAWVIYRRYNTKEETRNRD